MFPPALSSVPVPDDATAPSGSDAPAQFADLGLPQELLRTLAAQGLTSPFPVQTAAIPDALAGRDLLGRGRTGSGKTLAFGLPLLARTAATVPGRATPRRPHAVVLAPTRELALQVCDALRPYARSLGVFLAPIVGGASYERQFRDLDRGAHVLIATPGRLADLVERGAVDLSAVQITVLDEADQMADTGFLPAVCELLDLTAPGGQRMLFSATLDRRVQAVVDRYLHDAVEHHTDPVEASVPDMAHHVVKVAPRDKAAVVNEIASRRGRTLMFVRSRAGADTVALRLAERGLGAAALHGGMTQGARNRTLADFKDGVTPVLVATDVAARGIHVDGVDLVLHVDPPADHRDYLHRAGRTARAGKTGAVLTLALPHQVGPMKRLLRDAGLTVPAVDARPGDEVLARVAGARDPREAAAELVVVREARAEAARAERANRRPYDRDRRRPDRPRQGGYGSDRGRQGGSTDRPRRTGDDRPQRASGGARQGGFDDRPRQGGFDDRPRQGGFADRPRQGSLAERPRRTGEDRPARTHEDRPARTYGADRPARTYGADRPQRTYSDRPQRSWNDRPSRPATGPASDRRDGHPNGERRPQERRDVRRDDRSSRERREAP